MARKRNNHNRQKIPADLLVPFAVLLIFILFVSISSFRDPLYNFLFPKHPSQAAGITTPIKLIVTYQPPVYIGGVSLTATEINQKFQAIESTPDDDHWSGFSGPFLYYVIFDQTEGPSGLDTIAAQTQTCATLGKDSYVSAAENSVTTYFHGEFCQIHDSIVNHTGFDHDLNSTTNDVVATEGWFLHDGTGKRITFNQGSTVYYAVNPANQNWREYFIARLFRDLNFQPGQSINELHWLSRIKATGIFLDNVGLGWATFRNNSNNKTNPIDFSSSSAFSDAVFQFVQQIHSALHDPDPTKGINYPVWANMIAGSDTGSDWDRYIPYLEGGMNESFVLNWGTGLLSTTTILNQLTQMEKWIANGKVYHGVAWARYSDPTNLGIDFHFSLAAFLLATDGNNGYYKLRGSSYKYFYDYPEYYYQLGAPKGAKYQKSATPLIYRRDFECGFVELDLTNKVGTINYTPGCIPGTSPTSTYSPTPTPTPTPGQVLNVTNTPIPTPTSVPMQLTISGVQTSNTTTLSTTIRWTTSQLGTSWVEYGTSSFSLTNRTMIDSSLVTSHSVAISGLTKNTRYYYKVHSADSSGIDYASSLYNFRTRNR